MARYWLSELRYCPRLFNAALAKSYSLQSFSSVATDLRKASTAPVFGRVICPSSRSAPAGSILSNANFQWSASDTDALQELDHQIFTRLSAGRTIGEPSGISNAFWNSVRFETGPSTR